MTGQEADNRSLAGQRVAFRGRLAWMTRAEALALVRERGGECVASVTPRTSLLVLGQVSEPLGKDGRPSRWLVKARALERRGTLTVLAEGEFLNRMGLGSPANARRLTTTQLSQVLGVSSEKVRAWVRLGLVQPVETALGVHYFDFGQARWAKTLCELARAGVSSNRIRRSLQQLKRWLPEADQPLSQLAVLERDGKLLVRGDKGLLAEPSGQAVLDFGNEAGSEAVAFDPGPQNGEEWFEVGREQEEAGRLAEAADAYREALALAGPVARTCFNLGNVLYAQGHHEQAAQRFRQAVKAEPAFAAAWNNLGIALADLGKDEEGVVALRTALDLDPSYADAHYNLADVLDRLGRADEAKPHWRAYLRHDPIGPWGEYARWRIERAGEG
jgi:tetratricopeptide (TPR) repeat protein